MEIVVDQQSRGPADQPMRSPGLSAFVARVLDQLAISSWLPAVMLIGVGALLVQLQQSGNLDIPAAIEALASKPWGAIIILIFALVLASMVTQAFSFQAIRILEGYWGPSRLSQWATRQAVRRQLNQYHQAHSKVQDLEKQAFATARLKLRTVHPGDVINALEDRIQRLPAGEVKARNTVEAIQAANQISWRYHADPAAIAVLDRAYTRVAGFPNQPHRLLPTELGNTIRASEDKLNQVGGDLEGFVMRNYQWIPARLMIQHDQFRDRLDMYSSLVFVFLLLAAGAVPLLAYCAQYMLGSLAGASILLLGALLSYKAGVASAQGYGVTLASMRDYVPAHGRQTLAPAD